MYRLCAESCEIFCRRVHSGTCDDCVSLYAIPQLTNSSSSDSTLTNSIQRRYRMPISMCEAFWVPCLFRRQLRKPGHKPAQGVHLARQNCVYSVIHGPAGQHPIFRVRRTGSNVGGRGAPRGRRHPCASRSPDRYQGQTYNCHHTCLCADLFSDARPSLCADLFTDARPTPGS